MYRAEPTRKATSTEDAAVVEAARLGDKSAFTALTERYRRELRAYCYRMLGSFEDSEDLVQDTLLKAWRNRESFEGRSSLRSWLYRIATNGCLDFLASRKRVLSRDVPLEGAEPPPHVAWLEPYPDALLEPVSPSAAPDARGVAKERIELAVHVALQFLPPKQRAVSRNDGAGREQRLAAGSRDALRRPRRTAARADEPGHGARARISRPLRLGARAP